MIFRDDMPLPQRLVCLRAAAAEYRAKLMAERAADEIKRSIFGEHPDLHLHQLQCQISDLAYVIENRARNPQAYPAESAFVAQEALKEAA